MYMSSKQIFPEVAPPTGAWIETLYLAGIILKYMCRPSHRGVD